MGIRIGERDRRVERQLPLDGQGGLQNVWGAQRAVDLLNGLRGMEIRQRRNRRNQREKIRIRYHVLLLNHAVIALRRERIRQTEAIVEHAEAGA